jgi:glutamate-1-semialdehyde aminotransferase
MMQIICFGKVIGGGLPGAAAQKKYELSAPLGPVYQAELYQESVAMAAGLAVMIQFLMISGENGLLHGIEKY